MAKPSAWGDNREGVGMRNADNGEKRGPEIFRWHYDVYDITAVLKDLERGAVGERWEATFSRDEIAQYRAFLEGVPHVSVPPYMTEQHQIQISVTYASTLTEEDLMRPIIVLQVGQNDGTLELSGLEMGYNFVVADGNHRLIRAYQLGVESVPVVVLRAKIASRYRCPSFPFELPEE